MPSRSTAAPDRSARAVPGTTREVYVSTLQAEHVYKVFGNRPDDAVRALEGGGDRSEL
ncbi:glycine/betaine ABC transporter ATP-binding protein, partial [Streptomyces virginiae]